MAGKPNKGNKRLKDYGKVLMAKQLLRAIYNNPREKIFKRFFGKKMEIPIKGIHNVVGDPETKDGNPKNTVPTINKVFTSLSSRLEIVLTAMGGALSFQHARQLINHGKVSVNGYTIKQRHYLLKDGDIIISKAGLTHSGSLGFTESTSPSNHSSSFSQPNLRSKEDSQRLGFGVQLEKKIGGMKVAKLPGYLKIKTPVAATLLINSDLNLGIYYSKPLFTSFTQRETAPEEFTSFASSYA
jgi:ribosomal protein S4